ncbi:MAG: tRNA-dihydrouridine synthase [Bacteroidota bacterium]|nr:tRNA-dihydrouridine synthase [Bacteroidota bacterium]
MKNFTIGKYKFSKALFLAPMEGATDLPFRVMCKRRGADLVYSEFIASEALIRDSSKSFFKMNIAEEERPVAIQIFGGNIESMVQSASIVEDSGADILDINFGCWVKKVVNHNAGAAFLKHPEQMAEMAAAVASRVSIPITVKTRLGWDKDTIVIEQAAQMLEQAGISALAVHCRTRDMGFKGNADWSWIPKIKQAVNIPVILNGDVTSPQDVDRAFEETGCDAVMIGRAAMGNPFIFKAAKEYLNTGARLPEPDAEERINSCIEHFELNLEYKGYPRGLLEFRKHYSGYLKGLYNASSVRQKLVLMDNPAEIKAELFEYLEYLRKLERMMPFMQKKEEIECKL